MPRAAGLAKAGKANRQKRGVPTRRSGGVDLPNLPQFTGPPPGTFDPGMEAQVRSAERGLIDLIEKTRLEGRRESADTRLARQLLERKVRWGRADLNRRQGYAVEDAGIDRSHLQTSFARDLEDLAIAKQQGTEDFNRKLTEIQQRYATEAARQQQASVAQGTADAGTGAASDAVRAANQTFDRGEAQLSYNRFLDANALAERRAREDFASRSGLIDEDLGRQLTALGVQRFRLGRETGTQKRQLRRDLLRSVADRHTLLSHAKREYGLYASDVSQQAYYQAHQLNPNIVFPIPAAAGGRPAAPRVPRGPAVGVGGPAPLHPGVGRAIRPRRRLYYR